MRKTITYSTFAVATFAVILLFVTAKSYTQLGLAIVLYPAIAYLVLNLFPRKLKNDHEIKIELPARLANPKVVEEELEVDTEKTPVADTDRRAFLKLIGVAGISFFLFSIFSKRAQIPFLGKLGGSDYVGLSNTKGVAIDPAERQPLDGFQIAEIDDSIIAYYGFIDRNGAWYIMKEDTETSSFRYAKGDASFPQGWTNRAKLKYDYFYNV